MIIFMSRGKGFFLVHGYYILLWRIEWMKRWHPPNLHVYVGACWSLKLIFSVFLDFFPNLFIEADFFFAKHEYRHQFWLVLIVRLFQGFCSCLLIAGITGRHRIRLLGFHLGSWIRVVVLIFALWELYPQNYFHSPCLKENLGNANAKKHFPTKRHSKWGNVSAF